MALDFQEVRLIPGVNVQKTPTLNQAGIADAAFIRFRDGLIEKLGGWQKFYPFALGSIPRALWPWEDLDNNNRLGIGLTGGLKVLTSGTLTDITPQETLTSGAPNFSTTSGSPTVTIVDTNIANPNAGNWIFLGEQVYVGGILLFGLYEIQTVLSADSYTITAANASATSAFVSPPAAPVLSSVAGGALGGATYFVRLTYVNPSGETTPGPEASLAVLANNLLVVTSPAASGTATAYNVYAWTSSGFEVLQNASPITLGTNWTEPTSGLVSGTATSAMPTVNSTGGSLPFFVTTNGSSTVEVILKSHGLIAGQETFFLDSTTLGGVTITGAYGAEAPIATNSYNISASQLATSTATGFENSGNLRITYFIEVGPQPPGGGYGTGPYGGGTYGFGLPPTAGSGTPITATDWSLVNFGEDLIANPAGGPIFEWGPESGFLTANIIGQGPIIADGIILTQPQQILLAWQASFNGFPAPLRLAWTDAGNFLDWTPTSTNFAGGFTIARGSKVVGCAQGPNQFLALTDIGAWSGQYIGQPLVFSVIEVKEGCGLIGRKALGVAGTTFFWMSQRQVYQMDIGGAPESIPCSVWDYYFQQVDQTNLAKVQFFTNSQFNEIGWYFPIIGGNGENSNYIKYNRREGEWDYGPMGRSCWTDQSILGAPIAGASNGFIYQHEVSPDADGVALNAFLQTGDFTLGKGEEFMVTTMMIPDAKYGVQGGAQTGTLLWTFNAKNFPNDTPLTSGPFASTAATKFLEPRLRGRQFNMRVENQDLGSFWRLGLPRFLAAPDGRNPV